ncbi:Nup133-like nucleoporin [Mitosporidium daphniae]|uniref:Nup133-like nucleoporin n=1 Tax=Mitosporidium daphniae TaxID=1485682 RepID=A0A098VTJ1_9MICR|nr:Nup133-like nucleoporin [Mitosporidium daphniae]KGG52292.1 Nup133-like nucleoporin [Mitosporidium daphniae]|eukprot:XP_013238728.1 Nup133-like nucleoporin [Mitosporidium daphniae]
MDHLFSSLIISVALVCPMPGIRYHKLMLGVFVPAIEHLLIVATTSEISILGLMKRKKQNSSSSFGGLADMSPSARMASPLSKYSLIDTKLGISSEGVAMLSIAGTPEGLVFMGGNDGNIYQLNYEGDSNSWFSWSGGRKCKKINQTSSILSSLIPTIFRFGSVDPIVSLKIDSKRFLLYAVSNSGTIDILSFRRENLSQNSTIERIAKVQNVYEDFLKLCPQSLIYKKSDFDVVDIHPVTTNQSSNVYFIISTTVGVRVWYALAIQPASAAPSMLKMSAIPLHARLLPQDPGEGLSITTQATLTHCSFYNRGVFLSAQAKAQTEDVIFNCITEPSGKDRFEQTPRGTTSSGAFEHSKSVTPPALLELRGKYLPIMGKTWAIAEAPHSLTFDMLDNGSDFEEDSWLNGLSILHELIDVQSFSLRQFLILTNTGSLVLKMTLISSSSTHLQTIPDDDSTVFLLLLLALSPSKFGSKIPAPVSQQALSLLVCKKNTSAHSGGTSLAPHIRALITLFGRIVRRLWKLPVATIFQDHSRSVKGKKERIFFDNLLRVIQDDLELGIDWRNPDIIPDTHFKRLRDNVVGDGKLPVNIQCSLKSLTFELLFSSKQGHECLVEFVGAIMQKQLEKDAVLDPIVDVISQRCPMFLTPVDVLFFQHAAKIQSIIDRGDVVASSVQILKPHFSELSESRLAAICDQARVLFYHQSKAGVLIFVDAADICLSLFSCEFSLAKSARLSEEAVFSVLFALLDDALLVSNALRSVDPASFSPDDLYLFKLFDNLLDYVLQKSTVSIVHERVYDWMIKKSIPEYLIQKDRFEKILSNSIVVPSWAKDILWKFYVQRNMFYEAATVLCTLSQAEGEQEERLEVVSIQEEILVHLKAYTLEIASSCDISESDLQALIASLDKHLYSLSDLFNKITRPLKLYEFSLIIIDSAQYKHQASLVISLWTNILQHELASNNPSTLAICIAFKFSQLGPRFLPSEVAFPIDYLVDWISKTVYSGSIAVSSSFLNAVFGSSGITTDRLLSSFLQLLIDGKTHQMPWKLPVAKLFLCKELIEFLTVSKKHLSTDILEKVYSIAKESEGLCGDKYDNHVSEKIREMMQ